MISSTRNPSRTRHKSLESLVRLTAHAGFGGRLSGKGPNYRDLAGQPTLRKRPLGLPSWSDKLVGEVVRILLEAYYEPRFSGRSHGFRPGRGCHTALTEVAHTWKGTTWFIEGDISDCFGSLDHQVTISVLAEHIHDNRFLRLIKGMLRAGYLHWRSVMSRFCGMAACSDWLAVTSCSPRRGRVRAVRLLFRLRFVMLTRAGGALRLLFAVSRVAAAVLRCPGMPGSRRGGAGPGWRVAGGQTAGGAFGCASGVPAGSGSRCSRVAAGTACLLLRVLTFLMV